MVIKTKRSVPLCIVLDHLPFLFILFVQMPECTSRTPSSSTPAWPRKPRPTWSPWQHCINPGPLEWHACKKYRYCLTLIDLWLGWRSLNPQTKALESGSLKQNTKMIYYLYVKMYRGRILYKDDLSWLWMTWRGEMQQCGLLVGCTNERHCNYCSCLWQRGVHSSVSEKTKMPFVTQRLWAR